MSEVKLSQKYNNAEEAIFSGDGWQEGTRSAGLNPVMFKQVKSTASRAKNILLVGGVHGNETEGVRFMVDFCKEFAGGQGKDLGHNLYLVPCLNPDGFLSYERKNANGVDLNRNLPTKDWTSKVAEEKYFPGGSACSESENKFLVEAIESFQPDFIISFHSWKPMINVNGPCQPFAEKMNRFLNMVITDDIGYPTPGSLGTYTGWERNIPTITLEFERGVDLDSIYPYARNGILASFEAL